MHRCGDLLIPETDQQVCSRYNVTARQTRVRRLHSDASTVRRLPQPVTTRVFGEAKNTNFLKIFLQYVKHVDARSNKEQFINKLLHAYRITCRSLPEIFCWFSVLSRKAQVRSKSFRSLLEYLMNPFSSFSIHLFAFEPHSNPLI